MNTSLKRLRSILVSSEKLISLIISVPTTINENGMIIDM